jgi:hypothetical protein
LAFFVRCDSWIHPVADAIRLACLAAAIHSFGHELRLFGNFLSEPKGEAHISGEPGHGLDQTTLKQLNPRNSP